MATDTVDGGSMCGECRIWWKLRSNRCRRSVVIANIFWASSRNILLTWVVSEVNLNYDVPLYSQLDSVVRKSLICLLNPGARTCGTFTSPSRDNDKSAVSNLSFTPVYSQLKNNGDSGNGPCRLSLSFWMKRPGYVQHTHYILISWQQ